MKIISWNVNSIRARLPVVIKWLEKNQPDVVAIQETKTVDETFPSKEFAEIGYSSVLHGQKGYNGVACISKTPVSEVTTDISFPPNPKGVVEARVMFVTLHDGSRLGNVYAVNGESLESDKFTYKLKWFKVLIAFLKKEIKKYPKLLMVGDFNIAPSDLDVYDPIIWKDRVHVSKEERDLLKEIEAIGLTDVFRNMHPDAKNMFSWWDYRTRGFDTDRGLRIDISYASDSLLKNIISSSIDKEPRGWEKTSDHAPLINEVNIL